MANSGGERCDDGYGPLILFLKKFGLKILCLLVFVSLYTGVEYNYVQIQFCSQVGVWNWTGEAKKVIVFHSMHRI